MNHSASRPLAVETWSSFDLQSRPLSDIGAVVLADLAEVSTTTLTKLKSYVDAGGSVLVLVGPRTQATAWNQTELSFSQLAGIKLVEPSAVGDCASIRSIIRAQSRVRLLTFLTLAC